MSIARTPPPKCPNHPATEMLLGEELTMRGHMSSGEQGIAIWYCPLELAGYQGPGSYDVRLQGQEES